MQDDKPGEPTYTPSNPASKKKPPRKPDNEEGAKPKDTVIRDPSGSKRPKSK